jgi:hypothetical protein
MADTMPWFPRLTSRSEVYLSLGEVPNRSHVNKKLFVVTLLVSILVFVYGVFPTWNDQHNNRHVMGNIALLEAASKLLVRLQIGLLWTGFAPALDSFEPTGRPRLLQKS